MMKRIGLLVVLLIVVLFSGIVIFPKKNSSVVPGKIIQTSLVISPTSSISPSISQTTFCTSKDIKANISTEGAAGNIYGMVTLKNISSQKCTIEADKFVSAIFTSPNIVISPQGKKGPTKISLLPGQTIYSQIHYPNGPQCTSGITQTPVTFIYQISPNTNITFAPSGHLQAATVTTCKSVNEKTQLDVWSISIQPLQ